MDIIQGAGVNICSVLVGVAKYLYCNFSNELQY